MGGEARVRGMLIQAVVLEIGGRVVTGSQIPRPIASHNRPPVKLGPIMAPLTAPSGGYGQGQAGKGQGKGVNAANIQTSAPMLLYPFKGPSNNGMVGPG